MLSFWKNRLGFSPPIDRKQQLTSCNLSSSGGVPCSKTLSLNQLPLEILHAISHYLDIPDILQLRRVRTHFMRPVWRASSLNPAPLQVSRYLNDVSHYKEVWKDVYPNAEFVRPPGPFPSQSTHDLENALVRSFRVHRNFRRAGGDRPVKIEATTHRLGMIQYPGVALCASLVFGRFLLVAFRDRVHCYDLNLPNLHPSVIYRSTCGILQSVHCVYAIDGEGCPFSCVVLNKVTERTRQM